MDIFSCGVGKGKSKVTLRGAYGLDMPEGLWENLPMPKTLPDKPTLRDYQTYIAEMVRERGFDKNTIFQEYTLLAEEVGELAKAVRKQTAMHIDDASKQYETAHEAADVFMYLLEICNRCGVDLEEAFREKEAINEKRVWKSGPQETVAAK